MKRFAFVTICCGLLAATAGCRTDTGIQFDERGWGGPGLEYTLGGQDNTITIKAGMLMNKDFRWAESEFSFEFLDRRDLVWGVVLLDSVFAGARLEDLRRKNLSKTREGRYRLGRELSAGELWKYDMVADLMFAADSAGRSYKVLSVLSYERFLDGGTQGVLLRGVHDVRVTRNAWNKLTVKVEKGKLTYTVNGRPGQGVIQVDPRANGRLAILGYKKTGPLRIRNLQLGAKSPPN